MIACTSVPKDQSESEPDPDFVEVPGIEVLGVDAIFRYSVKD